jgi:hypothetical protein
MRQGFFRNHVCGIERLGFGRVRKRYIHHEYRLKQRVCHGENGPFFREFKEISLFPE